MSHTRVVVPLDASPEVTVVGGGPAGCAAASLLARWGHTVALYTRPPAETSALAESLPPSIRKLIDVIDFGAALDAASFLRSSGNTVWWGGHPARVEHFGDGRQGWQITKDALERLLQAHAAASGVALHAARVDATAVEHGAGFVLDCSGRAGVLARSRGLRAYEPARIVALTGVWKATPAFRLTDPTHTLIESYEGGWAWSVPEHVDTRVIAVMVDPAISGLARQVPAREVYLREVDKTVHMAGLARAGTLTGGPAGWNASMYHSSRYVDDRVLLVGDAASFIDPISSVGVKKALASGWLAAVAVHTSLLRPSMRDVALQFFAAREAEVYSSLRSMTERMFADAASGHAHAFWSDRLDEDGDADGHEGAAKAFERIRQEPRLRLARNLAAREEERPAVSGTEIVLEPRLIMAERPQGVRYAFGVDLIRLVSLAPHHTSVPDLFLAYNEGRATVEWPDFLRALSTAIAQNWVLWV